jgi:hypothetical protein
MSLKSPSRRRARDKYVTPIGYRDGVDILGLTAASIGRGVHSPSPGMFLGIDLVLGVLVVTLTWFERHTWELLLSFILIPVLAILASFLEFKTSFYFLSFVPILTGAWLHRLVEAVREHVNKDREMARELNRLRSQPRARL